MLRELSPDGEMHWEQQSSEGARHHVEPAVRHHTGTQCVCVCVCAPGPWTALHDQSREAKRQSLTRISE